MHESNTLNKSNRCLGVFAVLVFELGRGGTYCLCFSAYYNYFCVATGHAAHEIDVFR